jgi:hypothetical protein
MFEFCEMMKWTYQNQDRFEHRMCTPTVTSATAIVCVETDEDDDLFFLLFNGYHANTGSCCLH